MHLVSEIQDFEGKRVVVRTDWNVPHDKHKILDTSRMFATRCASRAFERALLSDAKTTDERMPMIAITTRSSIRVKPRLNLIAVFISLFIIYYAFAEIL